MDNSIWADIPDIDGAKINVTALRDAALEQRQTLLSFPEGSQVVVSTLPG
jgi:hypothetical protein